MFNNKWLLEDVDCVRKVENQTATTLINRSKDKAVFARLLVTELLEGKNVNLRVVERDDVDFLVESINHIDFDSEFLPIPQTSKAEV